ncbi:MAG: Crp/Fnr family transcriptional regulator [Solirubrobacteraceae bacterium]
MGTDSRTVCHVLREAPELAEWIPSERREKAIAQCVAPELRLAPGSWQAASSVAPEGTVGLLVLSGVLIRLVGVDGRRGAELLGDGDLIRPWQPEPDDSTLPLRSAWTIVEPTRLAVLDERFLASAVHYPELVGGLLAVAIERSRNFAVQLAIIHQARVDIRLHMLLWHLASRWGRVRTDATVLPLRLTHTVLADLVAARRPTVTSALSRLGRLGLVHFDGEVWVLSGGPPGELADAPAVRVAGD